MTERFTLPPGCEGLKIDSDGTRYGADRRGHITVDNPDHAAQIRDKGSKYIHKTAYYGTLLGDAGRCDCGFAPFGFSAVCPRCGRNLK